MININIPDITNANIQPDYTKYADFPGFIFYHSLKENYIINKTTLDIEVRPDYLLDTLNLPGSFSCLIGNNSSNVFIAQPETANLLKIQLDPNTGAVISREVTDIETIFLGLETADDVVITGGYVENNTVILLVIAEITSEHRAFLLVSTDNGGTFTSRSFDTTGAATSNLTPTGIARINFYETWYYLVYVNDRVGTDVYFFVISENDLLNTTDPVDYLQTISAGYGFGDANRKHINRQFVWNHNNLYTPSDDRSSLLQFRSSLHSFGLYTSKYPIPDFEFVSDNQAGLTVTQIQPNPDNTQLAFSLNSYLKQDTLTNGATPGFIQTFFDSHLLWNNIYSFSAANISLVDLASYTDDDFVVLNVRDNGGTIEPYVELRTNSIVNQSIDLNTIPLTRFNTGGVVWTGELVNEPLPGTWHPNDAIAQWISHDADTNIIAYGGVDFDYVLTLTIDLPVAATITGTVYYDNTILDILVDGVSQGLTFNTGGAFTSGELISLTLPKGPSVLTFQMRNTAALDPNPTGLKLVWNNLVLPSIPVAHSDIFVDPDEDRLYVSLEPFAWVIELSTGNILACIDLLAAELPGGPFLIPTGVDQTAGVPIKWKWLKEFNDVYIYNEYHDTTYTTVDDKFFYNWRIEPTDPSYHQMYSAFDLDVTTCTHLHYFFDLNNELHGILTSRTASSLSPTNFRSIQYRIAGLANFAQVTSDAVTAGPFVTKDVFIDLDGKVYLSKSEVPNGDPNTSLFVYVNDNSGDIDNGSYTIVIDGEASPFNYDTYELWTSQPVGYSAIASNNFDKMGKLVAIPGDFRGSTIINSTRYRQEDFTDLVTLYGNTVNLGANLIYNNTDEDVVLAKVGTTQHWTYFVIYNDVTSNYRIVRARSVYYPTT